jgi:transcription-repair coupling factor (superfamily II helicase)
LLQFGKNLVDRFGAIPRPTAELMNTIRLRWLAKDLGFEKVVLKQQTFVAYFVQNQKSAYYQSESFSRLMQYLAKYPARARMKEKNNKLTLVMDQMRNIDMVVQSLILMKNSIQPEIVVPE